MSEEAISELSDDELWTLLGNAEGLRRVDLLLELGERAGVRGDLASAALMFESAGAGAESVPDRRAAGHAYDRQGAALFRHGEFEESAMAYQRSADHFRAEGRDRDVANSLWGQGDALRRLGRWDEALRLAESVRPFAEAEQDGELSGRICEQQARALYMTDREEEALAVCQAGRDHFRSAGVPAGVAFVDDLALEICLYLDRLDQALDLATNCYVLARNTSRPDDDAHAECRLAETHLARGEFTDALTYADQARARCDEADSSVGLARAGKLRGAALAGLGRVPEALQVLVEARVLFDANGMDHPARVCDGMRSVCLHEAGRYEEAAAVNSRLIDALTDTDSVLELAWAVARRADDCVAAGEMSEVGPSVGPWLSRIERTDPRIRFALINILASKAIALEELGNSDEAAAVAEEALAMTSEDMVNSNTAYLYEVRARHLLEQGSEDAKRELAHAIAMHLAVGSIKRARDLSRHFMPQLQPQPKEKPELPIPNSRH